MRSQLVAAALVPQLLGAGAGAVSLWEPTGPYHVGYTQHVFNHSTPVDPTPNPGILLVTIYYPTLQAPNTTAPYVDATTAQIYEPAFGVPNGSLSTVTTQLQYQAPTLLGTHPAFANGSSPYPTLIFTPGAGGFVGIYKAYLSELASHGFTVVGIDHPGEALYTALPPDDGDDDDDTAPAGVAGSPAIMSGAAPAETYRQIYRYRVSDVQAVLAAPILPALVAKTGAPFNTTHLAVWGHSIGGAGAAGVIIAAQEQQQQAADNQTASNNKDNRIRAAANLDGTFQHLLALSPNGSVSHPDPSAPNPDLRTPFLELASARFGGREDGGSDATWALFNSNQTSAWLRDVYVNGTAHLDYCDLPLLVDGLGLRGSAAVAAQVGSIAGRKVTEVVTGLLVRFFNEMVGGGVPMGGVPGSADEFIDATPEAIVLAERN
ncbi:paf acetylhydrolase family protein [Diplodia corticola]|uniref:1-alkyl-2-acetylglycerophosphocholine esterase n=1 Tax=Diplodia corticola TaxID=236234 RepID=A0A1J9RY54_9PEZI|nr:paf acetylhydrolase family protein [Diplodia corticola]OJD32389.1 paf acetylhydrolase family protein [Diplodia corticola]